MYLISYEKVTNENILILILVESFLRWIMSPRFTDQPLLFTMCSWTSAMRIY